MTDLLERRDGTDLWVGGFAAMLDVVPVNIMATNRHFELVHITPHAQRALDTSTRRCVSWEGGSRDLLGESVHRMQKDPQRIGRLLEDPNTFPRHAHGGGVASSIVEIANSLEELVPRWRELIT